MDFGLKDKVVLVTGASKGLGAAIAHASPAFIKTPMVETMLDQIAHEKGFSNQEAEAYFLKENRPHIELKRGATSPEVAAVVVFLASEAASFIVGTNLRVDRGSVASI